MFAYVTLHNIGSVEFQVLHNFSTISRDKKCISSERKRGRGIFRLHTYPHMHKEHMSNMSFLHRLQQQMHFCISGAQRKDMHFSV